ncbi:MAG: hypothetical protein JJV98_20725 [Desulfosarcina sp.]|nr:hypothetical protein [Desulfobacterales bacterium]
MSEGKNFIDFIIEAKDNENLYQGFLQCQTAEELNNLFGENYDVSMADCHKLIRAKDELGIEEGTIPPAY